MLSVRNMSFRSKLVLHAIVTSGVALLIAGSVVIFRGWIERRESARRTLSVQADVIATNVAAAVTFNDERAAAEILRGLKADPNIIAAGIYTGDGKVFAKFIREGTDVSLLPVRDNSAYRFDGDILSLSRSIVLDGDRIGWVYVQYDLRDVYAELKTDAGVVVAVMFLSLIASIVFSSRFQRILTRPVTELVRTAQMISKKKDYSARATKLSGDELGTLADAFNEMLTRIQARDLSLQRARNELEQRVDERTAELAKSNQKLRREIVERTRIGKELHKLSVAMEQSPATVVITDTQGTIEYVNPRFTETSGYTDAEAIGENPRVLKSGNTPPDQYKVLWDTINAGKTWRGEFHNKKKNGELYWEAASISPIRNEQGVITHFLAVKEDITQRKQAEEELRRARAEAEAANQAKSEFLANMSHEIRTPMTAILGFTDVLLEHGNLEDAPPERIDAAKTIKRNGEHLIGIINDILDLSKIEAGKVVMERIACSPCQIIADLASLMRVRADAKGLPLDIEYAGAVPETIRTDPTRLRQILVNLIGNAIKFTEVGGVHVVTRFVDDGSEPVMQFDVVDTGLGMTEEQVAGLFQPFMQADTSTTRKFGGTGLGLTITKRLAELLSGDVAVVDTRPGVGTCFRVTVPTGPLDGVKMIEAPPAEASGVSDPTTQTANASEATPLQGCRILFAEDSPDNQVLISHVLKKAGAKVTVVENGKLAVDAALVTLEPGSPGFDLILMDIQMPVMDGYEATRLLRRKGYTGLIIALTAHAMTGDREKCINAGCDGYATKPIDRKKLVQMISESLESSSAKSSLQTASAAATPQPRVVTSQPGSRP